jgi:ABC-type phosphate/phosphonate transport system substrate-binding protein
MIAQTTGEDKGSAGSVFNLIIKIFYTSMLYIWKGVGGGRLPQQEGFKMCKLRRLFPGRALALVFSFLALLLFGGAQTASAQEFRLAIMQAQKGTAVKFKTLEAYFEKHGIQTRIVVPENYTAAAQMFADGRVDGMFSGSGVAGAMLIRKVANPLVRPVASNGTSTYWAVVLTRKGAPRFDGRADYFKGKKVASCALASSGELFLRSIPGARAAVAELKIVASHGDAIEAVKRGEADIAIVKNLVWDNLQAQYPTLERVGSDNGQNPNDTLIVSAKTDQAFVKKLMETLLALKSDPGTEAAAVRRDLGIQGYILTSAADFRHTLGLLQRAGVGEDYSFD